MARFSVLFASLALFACTPEDGADYSSDLDAQELNLAEGLSDDFGDTAATATVWNIGGDLLPGESETWTIQGVNQFYTDADVLDVRAPAGSMLTFNPLYHGSSFGSMVGLSRDGSDWATVIRGSSTSVEDGQIYAKMQGGDARAWTLEVEVYYSFRSDSIDWARHFDGAYALPTDGNAVQDRVERGALNVFRIDVPASGVEVDWWNVQSFGSKWAHLYTPDGAWLASEPMGDALVLDDAGIHYVVIGGDVGDFAISATPL